MIRVDVVRHITLCQLNGFQQNCELLGFVTNRDHVAFFDTVRRDVHFLAVHFHVAVVHELTGRENGWHELGAVDNGVQTTLKQTDQVLTSVTLHPGGILVGATELLLGHVTVIAFELLLGHELRAKVRDFAAAALAMFSSTAASAARRRAVNRENVVAMDAARSMIELGELPDAIMVAGDELAFGVIDALEDRNVAVPDDVMVTGFDGLPQASWAGYDLTTLTQPVELLVEQAIELLLQPTATDATPDIVVPGVVRMGRTTKSSSTPEPSENHG